MALIPFVVHDLGDLVWRSVLEPPQNLDGLELRRPKRLPVNGSLNVMSFLNRDLDQIKDILAQHCESPHPVNKDSQFEAVLDVQHFRPEEIEVKIVDNYLVVTAKHEERKDEHGWVSRQFVRKYQLPDDINVEHLTSKLSSDGLLTIVAPKKQPLKDETERTLNIEYTGRPFVNKTQEKPKTLQQSEEGKKKEEKKKE